MPGSDTTAVLTVHPLLHAIAAENIRFRETVSTIPFAHRLKTVQIADYTLVLDRGRVVEEGSWEGSSERDGVFRKMLAAQLARVSR